MKAASQIAQEPLDGLEVIQGCAQNGRPTPIRNPPRSGGKPITLTADDSELTDQDTLTVNITSPTNNPPVANAGPDQTTTNLTITLAGTATDDGLPNPPATLTTTWTTTGAGTIADPGSLNTTITYPGPGTYTITLTANDSELTSQDSLTVQIDEPPPAPSVAGYWMLEHDGTVYPFGAAPDLADAAAAAGSAHAVAMAATPSGQGYWILLSDGRVVSAGDAPDLGPGQAAAQALAPGETPASISSTPTGLGYWIFTDQGHGACLRRRCVSRRPEHGGLGRTRRLVCGYTGRCGVLHARL